MINILAEFQTNMNKGWTVYHQHRKSSRQLTM
jgi:hypothetical protein